MWCIKSCVFSCCQAAIEYSRNQVSYKKKRLLVRIKLRSAAQIGLGILIRLQKRLGHLCSFSFEDDRPSWHNCEEPGPASLNMEDGEYSLLCFSKGRHCFQLVNELDTRKGWVVDSFACYSSIQPKLINSAAALCAGATARLHRWGGHLLWGSCPPILHGPRQWLRPCHDQGSGNLV